jgi:hypothetical protein
MPALHGPIIRDYCSSGNLCSILTDINRTARKSAQRHPLMEMFHSKDVRSSLQSGFDKLQACLTTLQIAFQCTTGVSSHPSEQLKTLKQ